MKHKYLCLLFFAGVMSVNVFAQPTIKAQRVAGGKSEENLASMYLTQDGGLIAGGYSWSNISGEKTENSRGAIDYWVVKYDRAGNIQWDKTIGGSGYEGLTSLQQTSDGGYILGGSSDSHISGEKTENPRGAGDYWIVKLNSSGNIQWDKTIGGDQFDQLTSLQQTTDGGYILGGSSLSGISGEKTGDRRGNYDYWIVKLDGSGNVQWDKTIGGDKYDMMYAVQQTTDGGYILGGSTYSGISGEKTENSRGEYDYWIVKLDGLGNIQWDKTIGGSNSEWIGTTSLQQTTDGGYVVGGFSNSNISGEKTANSRGEYDYWIVKLDGLGSIQWDKTIGGSGGEGLYSLQQTSDSGYILGGHSNSNISGQKTENSRGFSDYWVVKLNNIGKKQWDKTIGGDSDDLLTSIKEVEKNRYVLGGSSYSKATGDKTRLSRGSNDFWLVGLINKVGGGTIVSAYENENKITTPINRDKKLIVYPNPAKNTITVNYTVQKKGKCIFEITDLTGNVLLRKEINAAIGSNITILDISRFINGVYFINIIKPDNTRENYQLNKE